MAMTLRRLLRIQIEAFCLYKEKEEGCLMLMGTLLNLFRDKEVKDACLDSIDIKPVYMVPMSFKIFRRMSEPEQVKGAIDFVGVINYMEHYVKDKSSSLNQNLHDFNIDMAVEFPLKLYDSVRLLLKMWLTDCVNLRCSIWKHNVQEVRRRPQSSSLEDTKRFKYLSSHIEAMLYSLRSDDVLKAHHLRTRRDLNGLYYVDCKDPYLKRYPKLSARGNTSPSIACFISQSLNVNDDYT
ncbi:hypothetical protein F2Q69_00019402, partial [Brassica cretica]